MRRILVCEPQCARTVHVPVNAALLAALAHAFPRARVTFAAERVHQELVIAELARCRPDVAAAIEQVGLEIPDRARPFGEVLRAEYACCRRYRALLNETVYDAAILASATDSFMFFLNMRAFVSTRRTPTLAILHAIVSTLDPALPRRRWRHYLGLRQVLNMPTPRNLRYAVLGEPILNRVTALLPSRAAARFVAFDLAYEFADAIDAPLPPQEPVCFGFLGGAAADKGFDAFLDLAEYAKTHAPGKARFIHVGFIADAALRERARTVLGEVHAAPLTQEAYRAALQTLTYVVWLGDPEKYAMTASASFLDALWAAKPGVYLRSAFLDHYATRMGDIGHLCASEEETRKTVIRLVEEFEPERYRAQQANIIAGRRLFAPEAVGEQLKALF